MTSHEPMKITFALTGYAPRPVGGYKVVFQYANHLAERGHDITIISSRGLRLDGGAGTRDVRALLERSWAHARQEWQTRVRHEGSPWFALHPDVTIRSAIGVPRYRPEPGERVIATAVGTARWVADTVAGTGAHGYYFIQHFEDWAAPREVVEQTWRLGLTNLVIAPWLVEHGDELGVETVLVPNGIDTTEFTPGPPIAERPLQVMGLVSQHEFKRPDVMADVMHQVAQARPAASFVAFGPHERDERLDAEVTYLHDPERTQLVEAFQRSRVYVCSSDAEGFGLPPAEATLCGAACVSTRNGGVDSYGEGFIRFAEPGDAQGLAEAVVDLLDDAAQAQRRADAGRDHIRTAFSLETAGDTFERALRHA